MSASSVITSQTKTAPGDSYVPVVDPATATVEEMDEWIVAQGGQSLSPQELKDFVASVHWANIKAENPGDPDFPFASALQ
jgi:hypothetical protein